MTGQLAPLVGVWLVRAVSRLLVQPLAGVAVDRWDRRRVVLLGQGANALLAAGFVFVDARTIWLALLLVFLMQSVEAFAGPAERAWLPSVVTDAELMSANSLTVTASRVAGLVGPALAGLMYARLGAQPLYLANAVSFLIALAASWRLPATMPAEGRRTAVSVWRDTVDGLGFAARSRVVGPILLMALVSSLMWRVVEIALVPVSTKVLHTGALGLGSLYACLAVGGAAGALATARIWRQGPPSLSALLLSYALPAIPIAVMALVPDPWVAGACMVVAGALVDVGGVGTAHMLQTKVPPELRGRTFAAMNMARAVGVLPVLFGIESSVGFFGLMGTIGFAAALMAAATLGAWWLAASALAESGGAVGS